jgi:hypothetical protein
MEKITFYSAQEDEIHLEDLFLFGCALYLRFNDIFNQFSYQYRVAGRIFKKNLINT